VKLVSFSVDPERDRPDVLKAYGKTFDAQSGRWSFLTTPEGGSRADVFEIARGFKLAAGPATKDAPIFHSEKFLLVDGAGQVRGIYSSNDPAELEKLARDAGELDSTGDAAR
jgi:protein SCO1/2